MKSDSPCTDVCQFDTRNKWCLGCGRSVDEIKGWRKLSPYHRTTLVRELKRRMEKMRKAQIEKKGTSTEPERAVHHDHARQDAPLLI